MPRLVVIDETTAQSTATPYSDHVAALEIAKSLLIDFLSDDEEADNIRDIDDWTDFPDDAVLLIEEGEVIGPDGKTIHGCWTGFISSDRCPTGGPLPIPLDEYIGNGDPNLYITGIGDQIVPDGTPVNSTPSTTDEGTHPIYQLYLDAKQDECDEEEDDEADYE